MKSVNTHQTIQAVTRHRGISPITKVVLTHCLEKYQTKREDGRPWDFSHASIEQGTGLSRRTVYNIMKVLIKSKVLKHYGQLTVKTRPMHLYLFVPEMLATLLKKDTDKNGMVTLDNASAVETTIEATQKGRHTDIETLLKKDSAKSETLILDNASAVETTIEATTKQRDSAKDSAKDSANGTHHKKSTKEDSTKEEEDSTRSGLSDLKHMEELFNQGSTSESVVYHSIVPGACNSVIPSSVPGSGLKITSTKVPCSGFNEAKPTRHLDRAMDTKHLDLAMDACHETVLRWSGVKVSPDVIKRRLDAFKVEMDQVSTPIEWIKLLADIAERIK